MKNRYLVVDMAVPQAAILLANTSPAASPPASVNGFGTLANAFSRPSFHTALAGALNAPGHTCSNTNAHTSSSEPTGRWSAPY